jgi:hypothetical protein
MDLTTVEICAADFPILLVESTFRQWSLYTSDEASADWRAVLKTPFNLTCQAKTVLTPKNMSVIDPPFRYPSG